jgi:hypothetical protein
METASLRSAAVIEPEDRRIPRSGCVEEKTNSMRQASNASAEREAAMARNPEMFGSTGARSSKVQASPLRAAASAREQKFRGSASHALMQPGVCQPLSKSRPASSTAGSRLGLLSKALPNPSLKPRPNGKTLAPRYSAVHHLQRGASVSPPVPA